MKNCILCLLMVFISIASYAQNIKLVGKVVDDKKQEIPFANIALLLVSDSSLVRGEASNLDGEFLIDQLEKKNYLIQVSFVGYKTETISLNLINNTESQLKQTITLQPDMVALQEVVVDGQRGVQSIDKITYTFSEEQIKKAVEARDLVSTLPNLHINRVNNGLSTVSGKSVLILINGVRATNQELQLIPADKIKRVEYFDVPPIRYMGAAEVVLNVETKPLDTGFVLSLYGNLGQFFSNGSAAASFVKGNNKFVLDYGIHANMYRDVQDTENGEYRYTIGETPYNYLYERKKRDFGLNNNFRFTYSKRIEDNYDFQVNATANIDNSHLRSNKDIIVTKDVTKEHATGLLNDDSKSVYPTLNLYYYKKFDKKNALTIDLMGSYFDNKQNTVSSQTGELGFDDHLDLKSQKTSFISEAIYERKLDRAKMTFGYRGHLNFLSNQIQNSLASQQTEDHINTQKHYLYGEITGRLESFMYRASLGGNYDTRSGEEGFDHLTFTPLFMVGYTLNNANSLRLSYESNTSMPNIQQLSDTRILIMKGFYRSGNPNLRNAHKQDFNLMHSYMSSKLYLQTSLFYTIDKHSIFGNYKYDENSVLYEMTNSEKDHEQGIRVNINYTPWEFLRLGASVGATHHDFKPNKEVAAIQYWSYPVRLFLSASYKSFSLDYYQILGGTIHNGLYKEGVEQAGTISLGYRYKNLTLEAKCYFPFIKDKTTNETTFQSIVYNKTDYHLKSKDHTLALSFSWNFFSGKYGSSVEKKVENSDDDKGLFNMK